ncbi:hypothetical protein BKA93DRAFT_488181 [Sparassis latifolia]
MNRAFAASPSRACKYRIILLGPVFLRSLASPKTQSCNSHDRFGNWFHSCFEQKDAAFIRVCRTAGGPFEVFEDLRSHVCSCIINRYRPLTYEYIMTQLDKTIDQLVWRNVQGDELSSKTM